jgi:hypothetical protein
MRMPISREEAANLLRCADLGLQAATSGHLTQEAMMLFYKTEVSKRPNREERDKFAILFREARGRGLKGPPAAFGEHKK